MFSSRRNLIFLAVVVLAELLGFSYQVRGNRDIPLLREVSILVITPIEKGIRTVTSSTWSVWHNYVDLRGARRENQDLIRQLNDIKLVNQRLQGEADQGKRLQVLFDFKQRLPSETLAAQVISSGGTDTSRLLVVDKGREAGLRPDMAVIVPDGIVGKVLRVFPHAAQVLLLTDANSGVACLLETSRIHGILRGQNKPLASLAYVRNQDKIAIGEKVFTSGEDRIYPKGLPVGVVVEAHPGETFQQIQVQPFAKLDRLEEVLVITKKVDVDLPSPAEPGQTAANMPLPAAAPTKGNKPPSPSKSPDARLSSPVPHSHSAPNANASAVSVPPRISPQHPVTPEPKAGLPAAAPFAASVAHGRKPVMPPTVPPAVAPGTH